MDTAIKILAFYDVWVMRGRRRAEGLHAFVTCEHAAQEHEWAHRGGPLDNFFLFWGGGRSAGAGILLSPTSPRLLFPYLPDAVVMRPGLQLHGP